VGTALVLSRIQRLFAHTRLTLSFIYLRSRASVGKRVRVSVFLRLRVRGRRADAVFRVAPPAVPIRGHRASRVRKRRRVRVCDLRTVRIGAFPNPNTVYSPWSSAVLVMH
jgi:hypothetical protein